MYIIIQDILYNGLCINCTILTEINNQIKEGEGGVRERERERQRERERERQRKREEREEREEASRNRTYKDHKMRAIR